MISRRQFNTTVASIAGMAGLPSMTISGIAKTLNSSQFHMPEESKPHLRTFMQWPVSRIVHPDHVFLEMLQQSIADIANTITQFEPVVMLIDTKYEASARKKLSSDIEIWNIPTDDLWARDSGPAFVVNSSNEMAISHFNFNGWGDKQVHRNDGKIAAKISERLKLPLLDNGLVGEPGGVESDGEGTLIAHESSWVNENRNKGSKAEVGNMLLKTLGAKKIIWAPGVKGADITDYHIDSLARFSEPGVILIQMPDKIDPEDPWSVSAFETFDILKEATDAQGKKFELVTVFEPKNTRVTSTDFVASYVNYYVCNGAVIAAQFGDKKADGNAKAILQDLYPDRKIITLNVDPVGEVGGGIHCATQQQPLN